MTNWAKDIGITLSALSRRISRGYSHPLNSRNQGAISRQPGYNQFKRILACNPGLTFEKFIDKVGVKPFPTSCLIKIDISKPSFIDNVKWVFITRACARAKLITFNGKTLSMRGWSIELGAHSTCIRQRLTTLKWSIEKALTTPVRKKAARKEGRKD